MTTTISSENDTSIGSGGDVADVVGSGGEIVEFNALPQFPNSVKWNPYNNMIALQVSDSVFVMDIHKDIKGVVQWDPIDTVDAYSHMSYHLKDRYIYHPSMFARYTTRYCRCSAWSPSIMHHPDGIITHNLNELESCCLAVCTTDHLLRIFRKPERSYERQWEEIYDLQAFMKAITDQFYKFEMNSCGSSRSDNNDNSDSESDNDEDGEGDHITSSSKRKRPRLDFSAPIVQVIDEDEVNGDDDVNNNRDADSKQIAIDSKNLINSILDDLVSGFMNISNFLEPKELERKKRRYTTSEVKWIETRTKELFTEHKDGISKAAIDKKKLKDDLLKRMKIRTRAIANKKRNDQTSDDSNSDREDKEEEKEETKKLAPSAATHTVKEEEHNKEDHEEEDGTRTQSTESIKLLNTPKSKNKTLPSKKRTFKAIIQNSVESETPEEFVHREQIADIMSMAWSGPISDYGLYFACGNKTGHVVLFRYSPTNFTNMFSISSYFKAHHGFVTSITFLKSSTRECILATGSSDGSVRFWKAPVAEDIDQALVEVTELVSISGESELGRSDDIPVNFFVTESRDDDTYLGIVKGCQCDLIKFNVSFDIIWISQFDEQDSIITGVAPFFSYYEPAKPPLLLVYLSSYDGTLSLWKLDDEDGSYQKVVIIPQDTMYPIWGCSLSPNRTHVAILRERPPQVANRADLEDRHKTKLFVLPVSDHVKHFMPEQVLDSYHYYLATIAQIPHRGTHYKFNPFDLIDTMINNLTTSQVLSIIDEMQRMETTPEASVTLQQLAYLSLVKLAKNYETVIQAALSGVVKDDTTQTREEYDIIEKKRLQIMHLLMYKNAVNSLSDVDGQSLPSDELELKSKLLICDWILLYHFENLSSDDDDERTTDQDKRKILSLLKAIYSQDTQSNALVPHVDKLLATYSHTKTQKKQKSSLSTDPTLLETDIPCRETCAFCPTPLKMSFKGALSSSCHHPRHKFNRDVFTMTVIREPRVACCRGCGVKTNTSTKKTECPLCANLFVSHR